MNIVTPGIERYCEQHTAPLQPLLEQLVRCTRERMDLPHMQVGRIEGAFLRMLCGAIGAKRVLELGTFTGFSALCMAEALPEDGELITCDQDPDALEIAREFFALSPHGKKISVRLGDGLASLRALPETPSFDLVFLDADKERYPEYYEAALPRLRGGGLLLADNTLWDGAVLAPKRFSDRGLHAFNQRVAEDPRVDHALLTIRDGIMLVRKR